MKKLYTKNKKDEKEGIEVERLGVFQEVNHEKRKESKKAPPKNWKGKIEK